MSELLDRWHQVKRRIARAAEAAGRPESSVQLLAVSKTRPASMIAELFAAGQTDFGENYLQEALEKMSELSNPDICWHFIGPLQSNKTRQVAMHFDWVHSVDRIKVAQRLNEQRPADLPPLKVLIQVNISDEVSKSGATIDQLPALANVIVEAPHLELTGLMAIPKAQPDTDEQRAVFRQMRQIRDELAEKLGQPLPVLSMGMSADMEAAIAEGSSCVRVGTDIFGARDYD